MNGTVLVKKRKRNVSHKAAMSERCSGILNPWSEPGLDQPRGDPAEKPRIPQYIEKEDKVLNLVCGMSCRVWVWQALERVRIEGDIDFERREILEQEIFNFGNADMFHFKYFMLSSLGR